MRRSEFIRSWRESLHLSVKDVAGPAGLLEPRLAAIESGTEAGVDELESIARVLGLRGEQLFDEDIPASAGSDVLRLLFKTAEGLQPPQSSKLAMLDAARAALDLLELHEALEEPRPQVPTLDKSKRIPDEPLYKLGRRQALAVRQQLALGKHRIDSLRDLLVLRLRIPVLAAHLGVHGPDAFSVFAPGRRMAVVLNVDGKHENHLVRRFTLAHELGHLIGDRPTQSGRGIACLIDSQKQIDIEVRANAFAVNLLLTSDVERKKNELLEPVVFRGVMEHWGIHYSALRLYVKNLLGLTDEKMARVCPKVDTGAPLSIRDAEELEAERSPLKAIPLPRRGELSRLVLQEHVAGRMSAGRARELLRLDATSDLRELVRTAGLT